MSESKIQILTSSMGLGTYIPSLFLYEYFELNGYGTEVELIESYFADKTREMFRKSKKLYHKNYKAALIGHKLAEQKLEFLIDPDMEKYIFEKWNKMDIKLFLVLSGNWVNLIKKYKKAYGEKEGRIVAVHLDAGRTPSWCHNRSEENIFDDIWVFEQGNVNFLLGHDLRKKEIFESDRRKEKKSVYIHGGGWGMGTYQNEYATFMNELPYEVKTTIHDRSEAVFREGWSYYLMDSKWEPWSTSEKKVMYPPLAEIDHDSERPINNEGHMGMYDLFQNCGAIISKPGGGTLIDSLITATPIIFLKPIAQHEARNQELWEHLGLGITYDNWKKENFSFDRLEDIYYKIIEYRKDIPFIGKYMLDLLEKEDTYA